MTEREMQTFNGFAVELVPTRTAWYRLGQLGTDSDSLVPTRTAWYRLGQLGTDSDRPLSRNWYRLEQLGTDSDSLVPTRTAPLAKRPLSQANLVRMARVRFLPPPKHEACFGLSTKQNASLY
jgi:hypothetical protein